MGTPHTVQVSGKNIRPLRPNRRPKQKQKKVIRQNECRKIFRHSSCLRTTLQKDKIRREKTKTNKKQEFFQKIKGIARGWWRGTKYSTKLGTDTIRKCTYYTSVTWIILASHPSEITVTRVGTCSRASSAIYYIFGRMRRPTPTTYSHDSP